MEMQGDADALGPENPQNPDETKAHPAAGELLPPAEQRATLLLAVREVPTSPGVYLMKGGRGEVLYVGKAKSLRSRLASYFQGDVHEIPRTDMLVRRVHRFDVILTETEAEALILECTLIKKHKPKFNVRLKDDKTYPYLKIRPLENEPFPRIEWTRRVSRDGARYFGPFPSSWSARQVMGLLNESFKLRDCSDNTFKHRTRPCILYQMGKCSGPCVGLIDRAGYAESIHQIVEVLEGKTDKLVGELRRGMEDAAEGERYEEAAELRDQIRNLELVTQTQGAIEAGSQRDRDVVAIARDGTDGHGAVLRIRGGRMVAVQHYHLQNLDPSLEPAELLADFLSQYYLGVAQTQAQKEAAEETAGANGEGAASSRSEALPSEVLLPISPSDPDLLERALGVGIRVADGEIDERLLSVAKANADYALEQLKKRGAGHGAEALEEIREKLGLERIPSRIECYDISNFQGDDSVASRVVFIDGAPDKNLYRRYKIKTVEGSNDFASMREVLGRRFGHMIEDGEGVREGEEMPDLVVVDGGKGQLSQAVAILEELNVQGVPVVGLAKARTESDFRSSEVKSSNERIFIPGRKNPIALHPHQAAYKLLVHVRDEAHRFAVSYHRVVRSKRSLKSGD